MPVTVRPRTRYTLRVQYLNEALVRTALQEYGVARISGPRHNSRVREFLDTVGLGRTDDTAWCAAFLRWLFLTVTGEAIGRANARSWETLDGPFDVTTIGSHDQAMAGDVVVLWRSSPRSWKGHVGLFIRSDSRGVWLLGGNQGGRVSIKRYPHRRVLAIRRFRGQAVRSCQSPPPVDMA